VHKGLLAQRNSKEKCTVLRREKKRDTEGKQALDT
jgi:hypothetical protein